MLMSYYIAYIVFNLAVALTITFLFARSGGVLLKAIVRCSTEVPLATVRILALVYGTLALGRVFLQVKPPRGLNGVEDVLFRLSETTGGNLMFFAVLAGIGILVLVATARPVVNLLADVDDTQLKRFPAVSR
ncbi:hypothetical protein [Kordiimonas gwangyangensis]|uniref:hypothetical protein n=1 Tax=Kordiimonas gwangyangensis TaxID=288022 RepID=UPI0003789489|nr:hypothetical protein [Kordiimonas gwangyangensis]